MTIPNEKTSKRKDNLYVLINLLNENGFSTQRLEPLHTIKL